VLVTVGILNGRLVASRIGATPAKRTRTPFIFRVLAGARPPSFFRRPLRTNSLLEHLDGFGRDLGATLGDGYRCLTE
jgi:hypothetical protein